MTAWLPIYGPAIAAVLIVGAYALWLLPRARSRVDDLTAVADAVQEPVPVLTVNRLHTGNLEITRSELTVDEAFRLAARLSLSASLVIHGQQAADQAEAYANGDLP